jgi:hypothetical protein
MAKFYGDLSCHHKISTMKSFDEIENAGLGLFLGINATVEADFTTGYTVIVLVNMDPPLAETIGIETAGKLEAIAD